MRRHRLLDEAGARPEHDRGDETGDTGIDVHHGAAGEVVGAEAEQEAGGGVGALGPPHHQTMWAIGR